MLEFVLTVFFIVFLDALVSAAEAAIYSVPLHKAQMLAKKGLLGKTLLKLKESMERPITTLIALSNFITIAGSIFAGIMAARYFGNEAMGVISAALTFLIMMFGEIIPKRIGERYSEQVSLASAPVVQFLSRIFSPVTWIISKMTAPFIEKREKTTSEEEIAFLATLAEEEGAIESGENQLIQKVFRLNDITAADIMTPRHLVTFVDGNKTVGELASFIQKVDHARLPVYDGDQNNIIGIVHQRNLLIALTKGETDQPVRNYAWDAAMVPDSRIVDDLLRDLREKKAQLGVVVSQYGNVLGVVGIEDILEELVGEIVDEKDVMPELIKRASKNEIVVHGQTRISYVNHFFNTDIKSKKTVNGFLLDKFGELPRAGSRTEYKGVIFIAEVVGPRTIERVRLLKKIEGEQGVSQIKTE
jgi:CBS domain containing-hemolysin-like protein